MDFSSKSADELLEVEGSLVAELTPDSPAEDHQTLFQLHCALSERLLPGSDYFKWLEKFHADLDVKTYLEIGVYLGSSLCLANENCDAVGVDPVVRVGDEFQGRAKLIEATSDEFFAQASESYKDYFELIFFDGLHTAEQTLTDFLNAMPLLKTGGQIILHDVLPITESVATPVRNTIFWTGDVWRISHVICDHERPWKWRVIPTPPSGLLWVYDVDKTINVDGDQLLSQLGTVSPEHFPARASWPFSGLIKNDLSYPLKN